MDAQSHFFLNIGEVHSDPELSPQITTETAQTDAAAYFSPGKRHGWYFFGIVEDRAVVRNIFLMETHSKGEKRNDEIQSPPNRRFFTNPRHRIGTYIHVAGGDVGKSANVSFTHCDLDKYTTINPHIINCTSATYSIL